ncbi:aminobenzoyl-glutamate transporter [Xenophilus sp. AP218F]|nr:aminobenzoyl-glutamate transporter [Xenophilus sp. AP218F]
MKLLDRSMDRLEKLGARLPELPTLFLLLSLLVIMVSALAAAYGWQEVHPQDGRLVSARSLLSGDGLRLIFSQAVRNYATFPPLFTVLVATLGVGLADESGLLRALLSRLAMAAPLWLLTPTVIFLGVISSVASVAGYVVLVPLAGLLFAAAGRPPQLGIAAAFSGVSGGFASNLVLSTQDPMLAGLTQQAAQLLDPAYLVSPLANYYFMAASVFLLTLGGWWVSEKLIAPRLERQYPPADSAAAMENDDPASRRGLRWAGLALLGFLAAMLALAVPENAPLRDPQTGSLLASPLMDGVVLVILLGFLIPGLAFGYGSGRFAGKGAAYQAMTRAIARMAPYMVLVFFVAQFLALFNASRLGTLLALSGASWLQSLALPNSLLLVAMVLLSALINLLIGSTGAKWAIMAPVFVPMFMLLGIRPELTQLGYRIGDSVTHMIAPLMVYYPMVLNALRRHQPDANVGSLLALMLPYSLCYLPLWLGFMLLWLQLGLPLGPGVAG